LIDLVKTLKSILVQIRGDRLMKYKIMFSTVVVFFLTTGANAGEIDGSAVLGSALGAGMGSAIGSATGGKDGAIIGGGLGGAIGAAAGSSEGSSQPTAQKVIVIEGDNHNDYYKHDNGKHKGQHKNKHKDR
jgi:hypothetical protein